MIDRAADSASSDSSSVGADGTLRIGAGVTLTRLIRDPRSAPEWPVLTHAATKSRHRFCRTWARWAATSCSTPAATTTTRATSGGRRSTSASRRTAHICWVAPSCPRCWAVQSSDLAPVMVALGAPVMLVGPDGERTIPAAALYQNDGIEYLSKQPDELLVRGRRYRPSPARGRAIARCVAAVRSIFRCWAWRRGRHSTARGGCRAARIVVGAVGSCPKQVPDAAAALMGGTLDDDQLDEAARIARQAGQAARQHRLHHRLAEGHGAGVRPPRAGGAAGPVGLHPATAPAPAWRSAWTRHQLPRCHGVPSRLPPRSCRAGKCRHRV